MPTVKPVRAPIIAAALKPGTNRGVARRLAAPPDGRSARLETACALLLPVPRAYLILPPSANDSSRRTGDRLSLRQHPARAILPRLSLPWPTP